MNAHPAGARRIDNRLLHSYLKTLSQKRLGLFICCWLDGENAEKQLKAAFPPSLLDHAIAKDYFGGELIANKLGFFERLIVTTLMKTRGDRSRFRIEQVATCFRANS